MSRVYGTNAVSDLLQNIPDAVTAILVPGASITMADEVVIADAEKLGIPIRDMPRDLLKQGAGGRGGARIAAEIRLATPVPLDSLRPTDDRQPLVLMLDSVTDPYNFGAIIRSAAFFGADAVIVGRDRSAPINDAAVRASAGAVAHVPVIRVANLARAIKDLKGMGIWVYAASASATIQANQADLDRSLCLVMGAEGKGIRPRIEALADETISIGQPKSVASLNVSVSAGILLAETRRQIANRPS
jgi:23S rRNA (guanosine2251-2'-O)-methyltransferase